MRNVHRTKKFEIRLDSPKVRQFIGVGRKLLKTYLILDKPLIKGQERGDY